MKKLLSVLFTCLVLAGCDIYKDDTPAMAEYTVEYRPNQPILVDLKTFTKSVHPSSFRIKTAPGAGEAEVISNSFLRYSPGENLEDYALVEILDASNAKIAEAKVNLRANESACGIATFDYAAIKSDSVLSINLADNDLICEPIYSASLIVEYLENSEGLSIVLPNTPGNIHISLDYQAPAGFTGTVRALYVAYVNVKDEYKDIPSDVLHRDYSEEEYAKYKVASLVEINVNDF